MPALRAATTQDLPLRLGRREDFARVGALLRDASFDQPTICRLLGIASLARLGAVRREDIDPAAAESAALALLVRAFLLLERVPPGELAEAFGADAFAAFRALDLLRLCDFGGTGESCYAPVLLCPVAGVWIASDRHNNPDGSEFVPPPDIVFPATFAGTLRFLRVISRSPAGDVLDLCSGTGIGALVLSRHAQRVVASDLTARATHFARFNRMLNACDNVEPVQGDLYAAVRGRTFDRIVAHPPYVPALTEAQIFRDAGESGERVLRDIIAGLPAHLRPGGTFYCVSAGWDSREGRFEERIRRWLGERHHEFDVVFALSEEQSPEAVAGWLAKRPEAAGPAGEGWEERFRDAGLERNVYGAIVLHRVGPGTGNAGRSGPVTVRLQLSELSDGASFEWALRWYRWRAEREAARDLSQALLDSRPRLGARLRVRVTYAPQDGSLAIAQVVLESDRPFRAATGIDSWMLPLVARFDGRRVAVEVYAAARDASELAEGFQPGDFAALVAMMIERGYLEVDDSLLQP